MPPKKLTGLVPQAYEHPSDAAALNALQHTVGLDLLVRKLNEWGFERFVRVQLTGSYLRVNSDNFPDLHGILTAACDVLDLPLQPDLYVAPGPINAFTAGVTRPLIVVTSGTIDILAPEELLFVIAHEVGHIKSGHVFYYQIAEFLPQIGEAIGAVTFGIGEMVFAGLNLALLHYKRMAEFTADRAGLLACQDAEVAFRTMMKLAGLPSKYCGTVNTADFIAQAREFQQLDTDAISRVAKWLSVLAASHPWTVMRAQRLLDWIDAKGYELVVADPKRVAEPALGVGSRSCRNCNRILSDTAIFCPYCGLTLGQAVQH